MPTPNEVLVKFRADASELVSTTQNIIDQFRVLNEQLQLRGFQGISDLDLSNVAEEAKRGSQRVQELNQQLELLQQIRKRGEGSRARIPISPEEAAATGLTPGATGVSRKQIDEQAIAAEQELIQLKEQRAQIEARIEEIARAYKIDLEQIIALSTKRQFIDEKIANIASGRFEQDLLQQRIQALQQVLDQLTASRTELESQVSRQLGTARGQRIEGARTDAERRLLQIQKELKANSEQIAATERRAADQKIRGTSRQLELERELVQLQSQRATLLRDEGLQQDKLAQAVSQQEAAIDLTGARKQLDEINALIGQTQEELFQTLRGGVGTFAPELKGLIQEIGQVQQQEGLEEEERQRKLFDIAQKIYDLKKKAAQVEGAEITPEALAQQRLANLPALERTLFTAFDDVGRRFRTALQFALSGAVIFAAQRLVREFFQAAIEVERTFADIESALEFDLADEGIARGSAAFNRRVEEIRRDVLRLANDFNLLPAEANDAAFKMVARFSEAGDALKAIRAQFLATKISTIDQNEAIRALSATAEGFASAVLDANAPLTLQERLLERERIAAENYGKALDEAVLIQQRFGVEVEDTLEGTARAAETFAQLGFSRQQTEATVAAVSRVLGQTGQNVAERLNRAFGAIVQPETRDSLLELAAASNELNLSLQDFDDGAELVRKLDAQFDRLQQREPQTALQLRNIVGQRRETEVVAAFFGTADLRRQIEASLRGAAGAAERRFSFLAETVSEKIQSIVSEFQSLAQNFERLELFGPVKVFLTLLDGALGTVNSLLQGFLSIFQVLDDIGASINFKLGTGLKNVLVTVLSIYSILRAAAATLAVVSVARANAARVGAAAAGSGGVLGALAPLFTALGVQVKQTGGIFKNMGATAKALGGLLAAGALHLANWTGWLVRSIPGIIGFQAKLGLSTTALGGWTIAVGAAVLALVSFIRSGSEAIENLRRISRIGAEAELVVRREERVSPFESPEERESRKAEVELDKLLEASDEASRGFFDTIIARWVPIADEATRDNIGVIEAGLRTLALGLAPPEESLIPGSQAWWEAQIEAAENAFFQAQLNAVAAGIAQIGEGAGGTDQELVGNLARRLAEVSRQFAQAGDDPEAREAAILALSQLQSDYDGVRQQLGLTAEGITQTTRQMIAQIQELQLDLQVGRVPVAQAPERFFQISEDLKARAEELSELARASTPEGQEEIKQALESADQAFLLGIEARRNEFARERNRLALIQNPALRLRAELANFQRELAFLRDQGLGGTEAELDVMDEIARTYSELAQVANDAAASVSRHGVEMARNLDEWVDAMKDLNRALIRTVRFIQISIGPFGSIPIPDPTSFRDVVNEIEANNRAIEDRLKEEAVIATEAAVRLAGPINSRLQQIKARIAGLRKRISQGFFSPGEAAQAQVELNEAIAQRIEAEAEAAAAYIRLQAGVGNSIRQTQAELTIVAKQLDITARLYGEQSAQYLQLKLSQENLKNELINANLELEDLNRRLDSDITDDFQQAQLDLVEIMRQLSQLDLGPLERARLELEKVQAEAAAEKSFFDDRLFQLQFDFETGEIGLSTYISSLRRLLENVDTSTKQGKKIFREISDLIESLTGDISDFQFNVPTSIRLPTIFEIRRALAADQLGVTYTDNRQQEINLTITDQLTLQQVLDALDGSIISGASRVPAGAAGITIGAF